MKLISTIIMILLLNTFITRAQFLNDTFEKCNHDTMPKINETVTILKDLPFYLDEESKHLLTIKLPKELSIDSVHGKAIVSVLIDKDGVIKWHSLLVLLLYNKYDDCFIDYRISYSDVTLFDTSLNNSEPVSIEIYPLPIRPYVMFFKKKIKLLKFIENKNVEKQKMNYYIPFTINGM